MAKCLIVEWKRKNFYFIKGIAVERHKGDVDEMVPGEAKKFEALGMVDICEDQTIHKIGRNGNVDS